ncbi:MAG: zinc transporter ZntB [Paracoccaceae bacterium]
MTAAEQNVTPIAAFDIANGGKATPIVGPHLTPEPTPGSTYRWLHFDIADPGLASWVALHLPPVAAAALLQPETRPRCDMHDGGLILNLRGINMNTGADSDDMVSLRLWVTETLIVSARVRRVFAADDLREEMATGSGPVNTAEWLCALSKSLTDRIELASLDLDDQTSALEDDLMTGGAENSSALMPLRRQAIRLRRYVGPQREALDRLSLVDAPMIGPTERVKLREIANRTMRSVEELEASALRLQVLQEHVHAQRAEAMSRNGFLLSIVAAIFLPLGFLTGLFGVNVAGMPGSDSPWAFAALSGGMLVIGLALYIYVRHLRWF